MISDDSQANSVPLVILGCQVEVELNTDSGLERLSVQIVPAEQADFDQGLLSESTPLAQAILGQPAGKIIPYPVGDVISVTVIEIRPGREQARQPGGGSSQREDKLRKVVDEIERRNAMLFAASYTGKWGDYDPQGMEHWDDGDKDESKTNE